MSLAVVLVILGLVYPLILLCWLSVRLNPNCVYCFSLTCRQYGLLISSMTMSLWWVCYVLRLLLFLFLVVFLVGLLCLRFRFVWLFVFRWCFVCVVCWLMSLGFGLSFVDWFGRCYLKALLLDCFILWLPDCLDILGCWLLVLLDWGWCVFSVGLYLSESS